MHLHKGYQTHHGRSGNVSHDLIIGRQPGLCLTSNEGREFYCVRPTLEEYILRKLKRRTQIIYPKDLGPVLIQGNIFPGARVLEAGIGSAAATLVLRRFLGPDGLLISYEKREEFARNSQATLEEFQRLYGGLLAEHVVQISDVYEGIDETDLDTVLLDVAEPHKAAPFAADALRINGMLLCWLPTVLQVFSLVRHLQDSALWAKVQTTETLVRPWHVGSKSVRPAQRMVGHTGFLICARRVQPVELNEMAR